MRFSVTGDKQLQQALKQLTSVQYDAIVKLNMTEIYNRGKRPGGTPVLTGELRQSLGLTKDGAGYDVGYTKQYAPDVEYGHRTVDGGYVKGQHFLKRNVDAQRPQMLQDIKDELKKAGGGHV